ncbi:serine/arginine repetitive matrix protein 1-like [Schistocerca nitens]|uniref:serine/arginine repetitive matrix protein 1-like n=1 Tax=Schistocerca nitens TaxID=7011 RepID=UPI0021184F63|nr:serine/arginine repetitive matrix protein 1-like [Schistocerca nitens]
MALPSPRLRHYRTMTAICFVCNLPILSHQVGLVWQGGNGWDDLVREQVEESTLRQRLGAGRRDSAAQITSVSPPTETQETSPPTTAGRRRRSSLAQLTDILREWGGGSSHGSRSLRGSSHKDPLTSRRETLADLAKSLPWGRSSTTTSAPPPETHTSSGFGFRKRRESSADATLTGRKRRDSSAISDLRSDLARLWSSRRDSSATSGATIITARDPAQRRGSGESARSGGRRDSATVIASSGSRRGSGESARSGSNELFISFNKACKEYPILQKNKSVASIEDISQTVIDLSDEEFTEDEITVLAKEGHFPVTPLKVPVEDEQRPSTSSTASDSGPSMAVPAPPPSSSVYYKSRRDSRSHASPERRSSGKESSGKFPRLPRQSTAVDESSLPPGPTLSPDLQPASDDGGGGPPGPGAGRKARRDSLSPDSASYSRGRRDSRTHLSPDRDREVSARHSLCSAQFLSISSACPYVCRRRQVSPVGRTRRGRLRRQSTSITGGPLSRAGSVCPPPPRSPDSCSSTCSSRDPSPCARERAGSSAGPIAHAPAIRRQSTTEEILIARGFRRQSTTEEMIRCRNFRRQSSQSAEECTRSRGRRDSSAQIIDGTFATMTVETSSTFFDSSTQTGE